MKNGAGKIIVAPGQRENSPVQSPRITNISRWRVSKMSDCGYNTSTICLRSLFVFRPQWTSKDTYGKHNAPSRYLRVC